MKLILVACLAALGCDAGQRRVETQAVAWPDADSMFRRDARWMGGDGAYSVDLGGGRVLWLFGDSFVATGANRVRSQSVLVRNSVGIQSGYDPSKASIAYAYRSDAMGKPGSFIAEEGDEWFWPGGGVKIDDRVVVFLYRVGPGGGLGFENRGSDVLVIENPGDEPLQWRMTRTRLPDNGMKIFPGSGGVQLDGEYLISYAVQEPSHDLFLARWPKHGDYTRPEWWDGSGYSDQPKVVVPSVGTEFSVHFDQVLGKWVLFEMRGFGAADLHVRTADRLEGPFGAPQKVFHPSESDRANILVYAGKAHPEIVGAQIVATYASNSFDFTTLVNDMSLYYPRFVRIELNE